MYKKSLFIFRRDLRIQDNIGLIESLQNSKEVIPCFIYDENILKKLKDSEFRWNFLNESLVDLDNELKKKGTSLQILEGKPEKIIDSIIMKHNLNAIFLNTDFTNYAQRRDEKIFQICKKNKISFHSTLDFLLHNPNEIKTNDGSPYTIYSFFYKKARQFPIKKIIKNIQKNYSKEIISDDQIKKSKIKNNEIIGGRKEALKILKNLNKFRDYDKVRDFPGLNQTTMLSAHNKFRKIAARKILAGRSTSAMLCAAIYITCRITDTPRTLQDVVNAGNVKKKVLQRTYRFIAKELDLSPEAYSPSEFVTRISKGLTLSQKTQRLAFKILDLCAKKQVSTSKNPMSMAAAAVYLASTITVEDVSQLKISKISGISAVTIRERSKEIVMKVGDVTIG